MLDYDVVIVGGTPAARSAALTATRFRARVALVEPENFWPECQQRKYTQVLGEVGRVVQQLQRQKFGIRCENFPVTGEAFGETLNWAKGVVANLEEYHSSASLAAHGVDIISGAGQFISKPHLGFVVNGRELRGLNYLLAVPSHPAIPAIPGLSSMSYVTGETVNQLITGGKLPTRLAIIGGSPAGVEWAQLFSRLGVQVTLVVQGSHILAKEDREAACLVQASLEAEGVRILTGTTVTQARLIQEQKWIQAGDQAIEADEILVAVGQVPALDSLNLEGAGVQGSQNQLILNSKLQTTNPKIYACGEVAGGYPFVHLANYEAEIALKNALFLPIFNVDYRGIPWAIFSDSPLARAGLTEAQAQRRYGEKICVYRHYFKMLDKAQMRGETTGFCKLIAQPNGEILGATIVGPEAGELIHPIALAMRQNLKISALAELPYITSSLSEILRNTVTAGQLPYQRNQRQYWWQNGLENLFHWRRYWAK